MSEGRDLERRIEEWAETALSIEAEPSPEESEWDWMDGEYARRKLGLPRALLREADETPT
jgi:hypothetical protein